MIAGLVRQSGDGRHDAAAVRRMLSAMQPPADAPRHPPIILEDGPAVLGILPDDLAVVGDAGPVRLTWSGRLDNPSELAAMCGAGPGTARATLLATAVARGADGIRACLGDFAFAAWTASDRRLVLARDAMGMRPLYYATTPDVFWWASTLAGLCATGWLPATMNEGYFAEYFADAPVSLTETPIVGAFRVPPGSQLELVRGAVSVSPYWTCDPTDEHPISDGDAAEQLRTLFTAAVAARLPSGSTAAFQLSGGLDSSSVVGVAHAIGVSAPATYSLTFPDRPEADESPFIDAVVERHGCRATAIAYRAPGVSGPAVFQSALDHGDLPELATGETLFAPLLQRARAQGHRVMLTGIGGDDYLSGSVFRAADLLRDGRLWAAAKYLRDYRAVWDISRFGAVRATVAPFVPAWLTRGIRARRPALHAPWLQDAFIARTGLPERMKGGFYRVPKRRSAVVRASLVHLWSGDSSHLHDALLRAGRNAGLDMRQPFLDRRLVEFLITLPDDLRFRDRQPRYLLRRALGAHLPPAVATRVDKADFARLTRDGLCAADPGHTLSRPMDVVERGWVNLEYARAAWRRIQQRMAAGDHSHDPEVQMLWQILAAEASVRALSSRHVHVPPV